uniref:Uncharacterized protein n=1 Tax=Stomoxys calcitrans TaxID=35570 RepID=A0A1I8PS96_STOCA
MTRVRITLFFFGLPSSATVSTTRTSSGSSFTSSSCSSSEGISSAGTSSTVTVVSGCLSSSSTVSIFVTSCLLPLTFLMTRVRITFFFLRFPSSETVSTTRTSSGISLISSGSSSSAGTSSTVTVVSGCLSSSSTVSILVTSCLSPLTFLMIRVRIFFLLGLPSSVIVSTTRTSSGISLTSSGCSSSGCSSSGCCSSSSTVTCFSPLNFLTTRVRVFFRLGLLSSRVSLSSSSGCSSTGNSSTVTVVSGCLSSSSTVSILVTSSLSPFTFLMTRVRIFFLLGLPSSDIDSITRTSSGISSTSSGSSFSWTVTSSTVTVVSGCLSSSSTVSILVTSCLSPLTFLMTRVRIFFLLGLPSSETVSTTRTSSGISFTSSGSSSSWTITSSTVTVVSGCLSSSSTVSILVTSCLSPLTFLITRVRIFFFFGLPSSETVSTTRISSGISFTSSGSSSSWTVTSSTVTVVSGSLSSSSTVSILVTSCLSPLTFLMTRVRIFFFLGLPSSETVSTTRTSSGISFTSSGSSSSWTLTSSTVTVVSGCLSSSSTVSILVTSCLSPLTFFMTRVRIFVFFGLPSSDTVSTTRISSGISFTSSGSSSRWTVTSSTVTVVSGCLSSSSTVSILVTSCLSPLTFFMTRVRIFFFFGLPFSETVSTTRTSSGISVTSSGCSSSAGSSSTVTVVSGCLSSSSTVSILVTSCLSPFTFLMTRVRIFFLLGLPSSETVSTTRTSSGISFTSSGSSSS